MRKIAFYGAISLDGYLADSTDGLQWLFDTPTGETTFSAFEQEVDTVVMGRRTYVEAKELLGGEALYPNKQVFVFSHTLDDVEGATVVSTDPSDFLSALREKDGGTIWIVGGGNLMKDIIREDLIDEWWVQIAPVILGHGKPLFEPTDYRTRLELLDTTRMDQLFEVHYRRVRKGEKASPMILADDEE